MVIKVNDTKKGNVSMNLNINWDTKNISVSINYWDKENHKIESEEYDASEFALALDKFDELEKKITKKEVA